MAVKTTQWLGLAMLLSVAVAAMAARQEDAAKPTGASVDAALAAKKYKDNYHKDDYKGGEYYNKGDEYYNKGGEYYPGKGEYYSKGGDYYPGKGEYYNKGGDYYPGKGEYYPNGDYYPNGEYYPGKGDYYGGQYPNGEYPHDYGYEHGFTVPSLKNKGTISECPFALGTQGKCTVTCPKIDGAYPFGCYAKSDNKEASVQCPQGRATNCNPGCVKADGSTGIMGENAIVSISGGYRNACWVRCSDGFGYVSAACK